MSTPPDAPKIYHITHVENLRSIVEDGGLVPDSTMVARGGPTVSIGMDNIKAARLQKEMPCYPDDVVGDYVPFNFCPRSVMLYVIYCANSPSLAYRGGQQPIVHLQADLHAVLDWAGERGTRWAFTEGNARAGYAVFHTERTELGSIDWEAVANRNFRDVFVKEAKQAELLMRGGIPWELVEEVGVLSLEVAGQASAAMRASAHRPPVVVQHEWYF